MQLRARQEVELLKVPLFESLARDALEEGNAVTIFLNFRGQHGESASSSFRHS